MSELQQTIHAKDPLAEFERQYKGSKEAIPESLTEDSTDGLRKSPDGDDEKGYQTETHRNTGDDNILSSMNYQTEQRPGSLENIDPSVTQDGNAMIRDLEKNWDNKDANNSEIKINVNKTQPIPGPRKTSLLSHTIQTTSTQSPSGLSGRKPRTTAKARWS
jgi:hypothetical protein